MDTRKNIIEYTKSQIGVKFQHQGRLLNVALDCAGLVVEVYKKAGLNVSDRKGYDHSPSSEQFLETIQENCVKISEDKIQIGDICIFSFGSEPQHVAIISSIDKENNIIKITHSLMSARRIVEHTLDKDWRNKLRGFYVHKELLEQESMVK